MSGPDRSGEAERITEHALGCDGNGVISCWKCAGAGGFCLHPDFYEDEHHSECDLWETCDECGGRGEFTCQACQDDWDAFMGDEDLLP